MQNSANGDLLAPALDDDDYVVQMIRRDHLHQNVFLFSAFHGCYTGGMAVAVAQTREKAIQKLLKSFQRSQAEEAERYRQEYSLRVAFDEVFRKADYKGCVLERLQTIDPMPRNPCVYQWEKLWNEIVVNSNVHKIDCPYRDVYTSAALDLRKKLEATLPCVFRMSLGTWDQRYGEEAIAITDNKDPADYVFVKELERCTVENGTLRILPVADFAFFQGGGD